MNNESISGMARPFLPEGNRPAERKKGVNNRKIILYLAPHQDDELTNLGVDLCREAAAGKEIRCLLFTDGASSFVRTFLNNREECPLHPGRHVYPMDRAAFAAARDREWKKSLGALGIPEEHAVIPPGRAQDGSLTEEMAQAILLDFLAECRGAHVTLKTILPVTGCRQHPDHISLGRAAEKIYRRGLVHALELFFEPILLDRPCPEKDGLLRVEPENPEQKKRLAEAAAAYGRWDPANGFYAVGYHSVKDEFDSFTASPFNLKKVFL